MIISLPSDLDDLGTYKSLDEQIKRGLSRLMSLICDGSYDAGLEIKMVKHAMS